MNFIQFTNDQMTGNSGRLLDYFPLMPVGNLMRALWSLDNHSPYFRTKQFSA